MRVLLTNDDGIFAEGLHALRKELEEVEGLELFIVAPDRERSASAHAITIHRPLHVEELNLNEGRSRAWAVNGTPADCTKLAVEAILRDRPDLVISGINRGSNLGTDVFYSGTVSAAIEGAILGLPSIAVSLATWENPDYTAAARYTRLLALKVAEVGLPPYTLLNVNVPPLDEQEIAGVAITRLGVRRYTNVFDRRVDPRGRVYYWMAGEVDDPDADPESDVMAIKNNMISVTPLHLDLTYHRLRKDLPNWDGILKFPVSECN